MTPNSLQYIFILFCIVFVKSEMDKSNSYASIHSLYNIVENISHMFDNLTYTDNNHDEIEMEETSRNIFLQMAVFNQHLNEFYYLDDVINKSTKEWDNLNKLRTIATKCMTRVNKNYQIFEDIANAKQKFNETFPPFANCIEPMSNIVADISASSSQQIPIWMQQLQLDGCSNGNLQLPAQHIIFEMYIAIVSFQLKTFIMDIFTIEYLWERRFLTKKESFTVEIELESQKLKSTLERYNSVMKNWVSASSRIIDNCDAKKLKRDVNFIELERTSQKIIMPKRRSGKTYSLMPACNSTSDDSNYCKPCNGAIRHCYDGPNFEFCATNAESSRRYEWIRSFSYLYQNVEASMMYGNMSECLGGKVQTRSEKDNLDVTYSICNCVENQKRSNRSTFIISSQKVEADVNRNMVITGIKFVKKDRIVYTQIRQGKLMPGGWINQSCVEWKPIETLNREKVDTQIGKNSKKYLHIDEFIVIRTAVREINLDDLQCPSNDYVLTGIRLALNNLTGIRLGLNNKTEISLFIKCHRVDFRHGKLILLNDTDFFKDQQPHETQLLIGGLPPDKVEEKHYSNSANGQFVKFQMSDLNQDAGQTIIPWFDAQNVTSMKSIPLVGAGLYHRGAKNSGGFLAYRLLSIDYSDLM